MRKPSTSWIKKAATITTVAAFNIIATINSLLLDYNLVKETRLDNGVIIYGDT